ncbi:MAG: hypothetical protein WC082_11230 [Victivallales bacterium]
MAEMEDAKAERFDAKLVYKLYDELTGRNWALRAFGALLESADLENKFGNSNPDGAEYRWGLNQIVELYIDHQERKLNELHDKVFNSPEEVIKAAESNCEMIRNGAFLSGEAALETCRKELVKVNRVIAEFGPEGYPAAGEVREKLTNLYDFIRFKMDPDGKSKAEEYREINKTP